MGKFTRKRIYKRGGAESKTSPIKQESNISPTKHVRTSGITPAIINGSISSKPHPDTQSINSRSSKTKSGVKLALPFKPTLPNNLNEKEDKPNPTADKKKIITDYKTEYNKLKGFCDMQKLAFTDIKKELKGFIIQSKIDEFEIYSLNNKIKNLTNDFISSRQSLGLTDDEINKDLENMMNPN